MTPENPYNAIVAQPQTENTDSQSRKESKAWGKSLVDQEEAQEWWLKWILFWIAAILLIVVSIIFACIAGIWAFHLTFPQFGWLCKDQLQSLERIVFASAFISVAGKYFDKFKMLKSNRD